MSRRAGAVLDRMPPVRASMFASLEYERETNCRSTSPRDVPGAMMLRPPADVQAAACDRDTNAIGTGAPPDQRLEALTRWGASPGQR